MNEVTAAYPEKVWIGPNFQNLGVFVLGESWYGDFTKELVTDDGYIRAYLDGKVVDSLYTRIANGVGMNKRLFWQSIMFTNFVQRVGPSRKHRPTQDHYALAAVRLARLLDEHSPRGVWILGKEQAQYSEPIIRRAGFPVEVVAHPSSYGVKHETLRASWTSLLEKFSTNPSSQ